MSNQHASYQSYKQQANDTQQRGKSLYYSVLTLYWLRHLQAAIASLGRMSLTPFATLLTVAVIGVSMALPAGLLVLLQNAESLIHTWKTSTQISVFLKVGTSEEQAQQIIAQLQQMPNITHVSYVSPQQGLAQFQQDSGFGKVLEALPNNPLPPVIAIQPLFDSQSSLQIKQLIDKLQHLPAVDTAQLDIEWVKRLYAIINLAKRGIWALGLLLGLGVILVCGNTIRLLTQNRRQEIEVLKLVGSSNAFIRRPFLYSGIFFGVFGAITAWFFVDIILLWLRSPISNLAQLYHSGFEINGLHLSSILLLLVLGGLLGFIGAFAAVSRHISAMNPT